MVDSFVSVGGVEFSPSSKYLELGEAGEKTLSKVCPMCGEKGLRVLKSNVGNHVDPSYWSLLDNNFWFCPTRDCDMVYFNNVRKIYFLKGEVRVPVFHKESGRDRPVCYCFNVTEQMIWNEVYTKGCCDTLEDIVAYTKAGTGRWCPITNPSGRCCKEYLEPLVREILSGLPVGVRRQGERIKASMEARPMREPLKLISLKVYGMTCEGCVASVRSALEEVGGLNIKVSLSEGSAELVVPLSVSNDDVVEAIVNRGYDAEIVGEKRMD